jgi:hypothetical protein
MAGQKAGIMSGTLSTFSPALYVMLKMEWLYSGNSWRPWRYDGSKYALITIY